MDSKTYWIIPLVEELLYSCLRNDGDIASETVDNGSNLRFSSRDPRGAVIIDVRQSVPSRVADANRTSL